MTEEIRLTQFSKGGGCGCKIAPSVLQQILATDEKPSFANLMVGNESSDDAAVYRLNEETAIISTTDFFVPIVDDPFDFGRIAAANAISDVYAMGGRPLMAVAILGWPVDKLSTGAAQTILDGGRAICKEAGIPLAGGHTIDTAEPIFGLAVTGTVHHAHIKKNSGAQEGDLLFLTKPLGVGVLSTALKRGVLNEEHYAVLLQQMTALNKIGEELGKIEAVHAMTDVTGFGLLGHAMEMATGSGVSVELYYTALKKISGLDGYLQQRTIPDATFRNWNSYSKDVSFDNGVNVMEAFNLLPDPQTNGGLLVAVSENALEEITALFTKYSLQEHITPIGRCVNRGEKAIVVKASA
ncbi:MAG TPA: selenide, water dikinase SelD [Flavisolibacter sp.]|jgi:selenide,water dikinase|nr:selenide, water dikinase SelD [Flavisolibacter sp.]